MIPNTLSGGEVINGDDFEITSEQLIESGLESITLPKGMRYIGDAFLNQQYNVKEIKVDEDNEHFMPEDGVLFSKEKDILFCYPCKSEATQYEVPASVTEIADLVFYSAENLETVVFNHGIHMIESGSSFSNIKNIYFSTPVAIEENEWWNFLYTCEGILFERNGKGLNVYLRSQEQKDDFELFMDGILENSSLITEFTQIVISDDFNW